jgi:hypothetical protein
MHKLAAILLCAAVAVAQTTGAGGSRDERWREDIRLLTERISSGHPNFFTQTSKERFQSAVEAALGAVPEKADHEVIVEMARLAAMGGDAHTSVSLLQPATRFRLFPLRMYRFSDGWHVISAPEGALRALGARIVAIGDVSIDAAVERVGAVVSHENEGWLAQNAAGLLVCPEVLHALGLGVSIDRARYRLRDAAGQEFILEVTPAAVALHSLHPARPVNPWYQRNANLNYWIAWLPESRTLYLKYNVCRDAPLLSIADLARSIVELGTTETVERLVVDLRNNTGGDSQVFRRLAQAIGPHPAFQNAVTSGKLFGIIGRQTFSSGMIAAADLLEAGAKLIGEPTGGRPNWYGEVTGFTLPNSALLVSLSTRFVALPAHTGTAIAPDVPVEFRAADFFAERDPYLETALRQ